MHSVRVLIKNMASPLISKTSPFRRPFTVIVEGNIGCGKTSFLEHYGRHEDVCILPEPVDLWRNLNGNNLLALMYQDPEKWSFTFQSYVQLTMLQNHAKQTKSPIKLIERSIYSARYCFVEKLARDGFMPRPALTVLDQWFQWITLQNLVSVDLIIYLRTSPEVAYDRILQRNRPEEKTVTLAQLQALHDIYEDWLFHKTIFNCPAPVLILNADLEKSVIETEYVKWEPYIFNKATSEARAF